MVPKHDRAGREPRKPSACAVCALRDARGLIEVELSSGALVMLCGTHELMLRRSNAAVTDVAALRALFAERRETDRRAPRHHDELAERLSEAFAPKRRVSERRAT
jgi:hypothetical protein